MRIKTTLAGLVTSVALAVGAFSGVAHAAAAQDLSGTAGSVISQVTDISPLTNGSNEEPEHD